MSWLMGTISLLVLMTSSSIVAVKEDVDKVLRNERTWKLSKFTTENQNGVDDEVFTTDELIQIICKSQIVLETDSRRMSNFIAFKTLSFITRSVNGVICTIIRSRKRLRQKFRFRYNHIHHTLKRLYMIQLRMLCIWE